MDYRATYEAKARKELSQYGKQRARVFEISRLEVEILFSAGSYEDACSMAESKKEEASDLAYLQNKGVVTEVKLRGVRS